MAIKQRPWASCDFRVLRQAVAEAVEILAQGSISTYLPANNAETAGYQQVACCFCGVSSLVAMAVARSVQTEPIFLLAEQELPLFTDIPKRERVRLTYRLVNHWLQLPQELLLNDDFAGTVLQLLRARFRTEWKSSRETIDAGLFEQILLTHVSTPPWLVEFMTEMTLGAELMARGFRIKEGNKQLVEAKQPSGQSAYVLSKASTGTAFPTVLDPACGSGRFLLHALSEFVETLCDAKGYSLAEAAHIGLEHIFGLEIDPIIVTVCRGQLLLKAIRICTDVDIPSLVMYLCKNIVLVQPLPEGILAQAGSLINNKVAEDLRLDAAWKSGPWAQTYDIVLMNPPYLDKRVYGSELKSFLKRYYPDSCGNLFAAFLQRMVEFCRIGGRWAMIAPQSWLYLKSYAQLRRFMAEENLFELMVHFGFGVFAETVDTAAVIGRRQPKVDWKLTCVDLFGSENKEEALQAYLRSGAGKTYTLSKAELSTIPDYAFCYRFSPMLRSMFRNNASLASIADIALGMKTSNNRQFLRYWWEVRKTSAREPANCRWKPYDKETSGYPFYRAPRFVIDWSPEAVAHYQTHYSAQLPNPKFWFAEGITFGMLSSRGFAAKYLPPGNMTDMSSNLIIPRDRKETWFLLGFLNSHLAGYLLHNLNPSINFQVRDLSRLPLCEVSADVHTYVSRLVQLIVHVERMRDSWDETSPEFSCPLLIQVDGQDLIDRLSRAWEIIREMKQRVHLALQIIDDIILDAYKIGKEEREYVRECEQAGMIRVIEHWTPKQSEWERRQVHALVSYAVGCVLGWWESGQNGSLPEYERVRATDEQEIKKWLKSCLGADSIAQLEESLGQPLGDYLFGSFLVEHRRIFGGKPIFAADQSGRISLVIPEAATE